MSTEIKPLYVTTKQAALLTGLSHDTITRKFRDPELLVQINAALGPGHLPAVVDHASPGDRPSEVMVGAGRKRKLITRRTRSALRIHVDAIAAYLRLVDVQNLETATAGAAA